MNTEKALRVLYITTMYPTPAYPQKGIFCHEQVKALNKIGVKVDVIVPMTIYDREYTKHWTYEDIEIQYIRFLNYREWLVLNTLDYPCTGH